MVNNKKCFFTVVLQRCCVFLCYLVVWFIISCTYFFRYHFNKAVTNPACKIKWEITPGDLAPSWNSVRLVFLVMWLRGREIILRIASLRIFSGGCVWRFLAHFQKLILPFQVLRHCPSRLYFYFAFLAPVIWGWWGELCWL